MGPVQRHVAEFESSNESHCLIIIVVLEKWLKKRTILKGASSDIIDRCVFVEEKALLLPMHTNCGITE